MDHVFWFLSSYNFVRNIITMYLYMNDYKGAEFVYYYILQHPIKVAIKEVEKLANCIQESVNTKESNKKRD